MERFPKEDPSPTYDWEDILKRKQELSQSLVTDWFMHHDADEIRESPRPSINLKDALYMVDQHGYTVIDFELLNFIPVDNNFKPGSNPAEYFKYFQLNDYIGNELQVEAWKRTKEEINILVFGGHIPEFPDRKIFPYKIVNPPLPYPLSATGRKEDIHGSGSAF